MDRLGFFVGAKMDLTTTTWMDSRSIADLTMKNHADVCRDIRKMIDELGEDESKFASVYQGGNGAFHQTRFTTEGVAWIAKKATKCG